ncbi:AAA domain-containing protein [Gordonia sp. PKS22-38]|uniref:AAA domain-containing protein n=1 Tax=Gordonia prachuapensis TaxID=3115651 RepID=A0ABU7MXL2_9ACTN|nr:AAA domain-containing protein [Gordonia sp. PKS22-38]
MPEQIGRHYVLIGADARSGGLATVRKGIDTRDGSPVAVKFVSGPSDLLTQKIFDRETKALRTLSHPNIVGFRDAGIDDTGTYYVVLDWVDRNLSDLLQERPWRSWDDVYGSVAKPLLEGLAYAHLKQLEHRDIKPANILIDNSGNPLLADFGIAKVRGDEPQSEITVHNFRSGAYAPPEREATIPYVRDVYSVGVVLLQCLSESKIRDFPDIKIALESVQVPSDVHDLLAACVSPDPTERPANASAVASAFNELAVDRVAEREQPRNPVSLSLTRKAQEHLAGEPVDLRRAAAKLRDDLSGEVFASFGMERESGSRDRNRIYLIGAEHRYTLLPDSQTVGFKVIAAQALEFERLEGARKHSCLLPPVFSWAVAQSVISELSDRAGQKLIDILDQFYEVVDDLKDESSEQAGEELFSLWDRVLDARDDLARGEHAPLAYRSVHVDVRRATFELTETCEVDLVGTNWEIVDKQSEWRYGNGEVIDQGADEITLLSPKSLPQLPATATLVPYNHLAAIALNRQREALVDVKGGTTPSRNLRTILVDPSLNSEPAIHVIDDWLSELDPIKQKAVQLALGAQDALVVQGPPGTGKTRFITETVAQFLEQKPDARVLIASQTHVAVDNSVERLHAAGVKGLVRLAGDNHLVVQPGVRHLLLDRQRRKWVGKIRNHAASNLSERAQELGVEADHVRAALTLEQLAVVSSNIETINQRIGANGSDRVDQPSDLATAVDEDSHRGELQAKLDQLSDRHDELTKIAQSYLAGDLTIPGDIGSVEARAAIDALLGSSTPVRQLLKRLELQASWLEEIGVEDGLTSIFLSGTSVVAGTCTGFLRIKSVRELEFDLCIVDEASKATITEALIPMSRAKRWILVGDTRQLPPMDEDLLRATKLMQEHELTPDNVKETLFQRFVDHLPGHSQLVLQEQYRMIRPIGDMISTCFYDGKLRSPKTHGLEGYERVLGRTVRWIDTGPFGAARRESGVTSYANRTEAQLLVKQLLMIDNAVEHGLIQAPDGDNLEVLVIAPYKKQVEDLKRRLAPRAFQHLTTTVLSVDAVQGRESDLALVSLTRSNSENRLGFLGAEYWRRINVALSRARYGLTIIGDAGFVRETNGALRSVLEYIENHPADCEVRLADRD